MKALPLALAAGGGYLLWNYRDSLPGIFGGTATAPSSGGGSTAPPASTGGGSSTAPPVDTNVGRFPTTDPRETLVRKAASGDAAAVTQADAQGIKYNADQWTWYRWQQTGQVTTTDLFPPGDRNFPMLVSDYLARRSGAGLNGVGLGSLGAFALVSAAIQEAARSRRTARGGNCAPFGMFELPDGACTSVDPSKWAWQCEPGIGSEASCVGVPEDTYIPPAQQGLLPTIPAPPALVTRIDREKTNRYGLWDACHERGPLFFSDMPVPCGDVELVAPSAGAPDVPGASIPLDVSAGDFSGCLIACFVVAAAAFEVVGVHHGRR